MTEFNGTNGDDRIAGTSKADIIYSAGGNDVIVSGAGDDHVFASGGNDIIQAGDGNDLSYGGDGNDILSGGNGDDILLGGAGNDVLSGDAGNDILSGGTGSDTFQFKAGFGQDTITDFEFGVDKLNIYAGAEGNAKNISISSFADLQKAIADTGATVSDAGHGAVLITFASGDSLKMLNLADDFGFSSSGPNAAGTSGNDILHAGEAPSQIVGGGGDDIALAGSGASSIQGNDGIDTLIGGAGNDVIGGQAGDDILFGNGGNDTLAGGAGNDTLIGGDGKDTFLFQGDFGKDVITDLNFGEGDALSFVGAGGGIGTTKVTDLAGLQSLIDATSASVAYAGDTATITFDADHVIKLVGTEGLVSA